MAGMNREKLRDRLKALSELADSMRNVVDSDLSDEALREELPGAVVALEICVGAIKEGAS